MTHETLMNEKRFLACMCLIRHMRKEGLLSASEYGEARRLLIERYRPKISVLFE
ncbi:MAG: SHOCT domain-containing protein [Aristaeellaceae bacterium]